MSGLFLKIIKGEIPSYKVYEDENTFAFLDINPAAKGHTLVIPKREIDLLWDLENEDYKAVMDSAKKIAIAIQKSVECKRVGMAVVGLEVPHAHVHLIPLNAMSDFSFSNKLQLSEEEFKSIQKRIVRNL
ncbi:HIT domain-containing protein [Hyphobacterium sp. CCMP332]|nr:HIT domain-containing protein [Hyphobacterium sp. CCMP332]